MSSKHFLCLMASTGAAAALVAAGQSNDVECVVSRGGRPDLAGEALRKVKAPTLLIVGGLDHQVIGLNKVAAASMPGDVKLVIVPGASHLFEEAGTLEQVCALTSYWLSNYLIQASNLDGGKTNKNG